MGKIYDWFRRHNINPIRLAYHIPILVGITYGYIVKDPLLLVVSLAIFTGLTVYRVAKGEIKILSSDY